MKRLICLPLRCSHGGLKKSLYTTQVKDGFFGPVTSFPSSRQLSFPCAVAGLLVDLTYLHLQSMPVTVLFQALDFARGGRQHRFVHFQSPSCLAGRHLFQCHFVKEYIVTITNHIRRIEDLAEQVIEHVDARDYQKAHSALDDIGTRVRLAHEHLDHLQTVTPRVPVPAGD